MRGSIVRPASRRNTGDWKRPPTRQATTRSAACPRRPVCASARRRTRARRAHSISCRWIRSGYAGVIYNWDLPRGDARRHARRDPVGDGLDGQPEDADGQRRGLPFRPWPRRHERCEGRVPHRRHSAGNTHPSGSADWVCRVGHEIDFLEGQSIERKILMERVTTSIGSMSEPAPRHATR